MANNENLKPFTSDQSREEAVKNGKKGGIASGKARRKKKEMREELITILEEKITDKQTGKKTKLQRAILLAQVKEALKGKTKAAEFIRDTIGEKPTDKIEQVNQTPSIVVATQEQADLIKQIQNVKIN